MRYGRRHFYGIGCRDRDLHRGRRMESRLRSEDYPVKNPWPVWAIVAYLAGYRGLMP